MYLEMIALGKRIVSELKNYNYNFDLSATELARKEADACLLSAAKTYLDNPHLEGEREKFLRALSAFGPLSNLSRG